MAENREKTRELVPRTGVVPANKEKCAIKGCHEYVCVTTTFSEQNRQLMFCCGCWEAYHALIIETWGSKATYYVCSDTIFERLRAETRALFERYPEDDGVMIFKPDERIRELEAEAVTLRAMVEQLRLEGVEGEA